MSEHQFYKCKQPCEKTDCEYCDGGLAFCVICKEGEGGLEKDCPGTPLIERAREFLVHGDWVLDRDFSVNDVLELMPDFALAVSQEAVKAEREKLWSRIGDSNILEKFRSQLRMNIAEGDFDFTTIFEEIEYEGEKYADISDKGIDDIVSQAANVLEMVLEESSTEITALEFADELKEQI